MSLDLDLDLDAPPPPPRSRSRGLPIAVAVLTLALVAAALGAVVRTLTTPMPVAAAPEAGLSLLEAHFDGGAVATLQLTVHNGDAQPLTVQTLRADGIRADRVDVPVRQSIGPGQTVTLPVRVVPGCDRGTTTRPLTASMLLADGREVPVLPVREVEPPGAFCRKVSEQLPRGWDDPVFGGYAVPQPNGDLNVTVNQRVGVASVVGIWAGDTLVETREPVRVTEGAVEPFVLRSPDTCVLSLNGIAPVGLRLMTTAEDGLHAHYLPLGPVLAAWLTHRC